MKISIFFRSAALLLLVLAAFSLTSPLSAQSGVIKFTTSIPVGEEITIWVASNSEPQFEGLKIRGVHPLVPHDEEEYQAIVLSPEITIKGKITEFAAVDQQLIDLDLSRVTTLRRVVCYKNKIRELDFSKNPSLQRIEIYGNLIRGERMTRTMQSLPVATNKLYDDIFVIDSQAKVETNVCTVSDVAIAKAKGWDVRDINGNPWDEISAIDNGLVYPGGEPVEDPSFAVTVQTPTNGEIRVDGAADLSKVRMGTELTVSVSETQGYKLSRLMANELNITSLKRFVVDAPIQVRAEFGTIENINQMEVNAFKLYPTVTKDKAYIEQAKPDVEIFVFSMDGQLVASTKTDSRGRATIDISALAAATYTVTVADSKSKLIKR